MNEITLPTELERALARPDVDFLKQVIAEQYAWHSAESSDRGNEDLVLDPIIFDQDDPERNLALVAIAMATYDDEDYLGLVSAGILEDIFFMEQHVPHALLQRIETEALKNPRFRWMLSGMYTDSFKPECRELVHRLTVGLSIEDALPPMAGL